MTIYGGTMSLIKKILNKYKLFKKDKKAATSIEYGLIAVLISVGCIAGYRTIGQQLSLTFSRVGSELTAGVGG